MKNAKMRIFFVITQAEWGGAQTFVYRAALEAIRRGHEVLVSAGGEGELEKRCISANIPYKKLKKIERNINPLAEISAVFELVSAMKEWKPDVAFLFSAKAGVIGAIAARLAGVKRVVYRIGGWSFLDPVSNFQKIIRTWSERIIAPFKNVIIVQHPGDEALAIAKHIRPRQHITVISNGLDVNAFDQTLLPREEAREELEALSGINRSEERPARNASQGSVCVAGGGACVPRSFSEGGRSEKTLIVTIANFYATKDISNLLHAANIVRQKKSDVQFIVIGDGGDQREEIYALRKTLGLESIVAFPRMIPTAQTLLSGADIFLLSSAKEGNPWALHEAMAARLPCVVTDVGACAWLLNQGVGRGAWGVGEESPSDDSHAGWVVPAKNPEALANAIIDALDHPEEAKRRGELARRIVETKFTEAEMWEKTFKELGN
ncbi:MAG: glycosyltransferase [Patescibacteria group bacterium]